MTEYDCPHCNNDPQGCAHCRLIRKIETAEQRRIQEIREIAKLDPNSLEGDPSDWDKRTQQEIVKERRRGIGIVVDNEPPNAELWRRSIR